MTTLTPGPSTACNAWLERLERRLQAPPGLEAARPYEPFPQDGRHYEARSSETMRPAAVLALFYKKDGRWLLPLTVRSARMSRHAGQVCLPGGAIDPGETLEEAAVRELHEEINAEAARIRVLGRLTPLTTYVTNFWIQPIVAVTHDEPCWKINPHEIDELLEIPLDELRAPTAFHPKGAPPSRGTGDRNETQARRNPHFLWRGRRIWGVTCMILGELLAALEA